MPRGKTPDSVRYVFARDRSYLRTPGSPYPTLIDRGMAVPADHPLVLAHPMAFQSEPVLVWPRDWVPPVEQATAAPGELRD